MIRQKYKLKDWLRDKQAKRVSRMGIYWQVLHQSKKKPKPYHPKNLTEKEFQNYLNQLSKSKIQ